MRDVEYIVMSLGGVVGLALLWWVGWSFLGTGALTLALPAVVAIGVVGLLVVGALLWIAWESRVVRRRAERQLANRCVRCDQPISKGDVRCCKCGEGVWRATQPTAARGAAQTLCPPDNLDDD